MSLPVHNFLKTVVEALRNDVPNRDYSKLSRNAVQHARRDLVRLIEAIPGANYQNVKLLRAQLNIAEHGYWSQFNVDTIEDAALEYYVLVKVGTETKEKLEQEKRLKEELSKKPKQTTEPPTIKKEELLNADTKPEENGEVTETTVKQTDTTESPSREKEKQEKTEIDNEDVPMPTIKHVDTAELLRRSKDAGDKLKDGNPSIADLNDLNRPTKLAEMFLELYDNEWTDALEILTKDKVPERQAIDTLLGYLEAAFGNCKSDVEQKKSQLNEAESEQSVTEILKNVTEDQMNNLQQTIGDKVIGDNKNQVIRSYIDECVRLTYLMNIQNPPMTLLRQEPDTMFNSSYFKEYTRTGETVEYLVWPALLLHENGPVAAKGVVQVKQKS